MSHTTTSTPASSSSIRSSHPERYDGVRTRRIFAFLVDAAVVLFLMVVAYRRHRHSRRLHSRPRLVPPSGGLAGGRDPLCGADPRRAGLGDARHALHRHRDAHGERRPDGLRAGAAPRAPLLVLRRHPDAVHAARGAVHRPASSCFTIWSSARSPSATSWRRCDGAPAVGTLGASRLCTSCVRLLRRGMMPA